MNSILAILAPDDRKMLECHLEQVDLPARQRLVSARRVIEHVYFLQAGLATVLHAGRRGQQVEVGLVGREGCTGVSVLLGVDRAPHEVCMQIAGTGIRVSVADLRRVMVRRPQVREVLLRYLYTVGLQQEESALAAARATISQRLARWLVMAQDRVGDVIPMTHDVLAALMGVRRSGITIAMHRFKHLEIVDSERGLLTINDRGKLLEQAGVFYGLPQAEFERLFGAANEHPSTQAKQFATAPSRL